jgi:hypothetical protein
MITPTETVTWDKNGHTVEIVVSPRSLDISLDGKRLCTTGMFQPAPAHMKAQGAVAVAGPLALTQERHDQLQAVWNRVKAQPAQSEPIDEFFKLEGALITAREGVRTHMDRSHGNPAQAYAQEAKAEKDLQAWIDAHQDDESYRSEIARRKRTAVTYQEAYNLSQDGRGQDY